MQAIILAGGLGTRLQAVNPSAPKFLMPVGGRPFSDWILKSLSDAGFSTVVLCLGHLADQVERHYGAGPAFGMKISYSYDGDALCGTGGALVRALPLMERDFCVLYGDSFLQLDYRALFEDFHRQPAHVAGMMTVLKNRDSWDSSNVIFRNGSLICYDKRNKSPEMHYIDYGASLLKRELIESLPARQFIDLASVYEQLVAEGRMVGHEVFSRFYEIGTPASWREADQFFSGLL